MAVKELKLDSVVTDCQSNIIKSLKVSLTYADLSKKITQFSQDDVLVVKAIKKGNLGTYLGKVTKISDSLESQYFVLDLSESNQTYIEKFFIPEIKDISNLSCPEYDVELDKYGDVIVDTTTGGDTTGGEDTTGDTTTGGEDTTGDTTTGGDTAGGEDTTGDTTTGEDTTGDTTTGGDTTGV